MEYIGEISMLSSINEGRKKLAAIETMWKKENKHVRIKKKIKQQKQNENFLKILY